MNEELEIFNRISQGETRAYQELMRRYYPRIRAYVASRLNDNQYIDDLAQDVFVTAWNRMSDYRAEETAFWPWIVGIAHNLVRNHWRKMSTQSSIKDQLRQEVDAFVFEMPHTEHDENKDGKYIKKLQSCVGKLTGSSREIIQERYFEGVKVQDIADGRNMTPNSVSALLYRTRQILRKCVESEASRVH